MMLINVKLTKNYLLIIFVEPLVKEQTGHPLPLLRTYILTLD